MKRKFGHAHQPIAELAAVQARAHPAHAAHTPVPPQMKKPAHIWRRGAARIPSGRKGA